MSELHTDNNETYKAFLQTLVVNLKLMIEESSKENEFQEGRSFCLYEVLSLIQDDASNAFDIPLKELGLDDYDLDQFLYRK